MSCNSFNTIFVLICSGCLEECNGETGLRDRVRVYSQHKTTRASKIKIEEHIQICGRGSFKIFPILQMQ